MGLLDILNGMQNGPRGTQQPTPPGGSGSGMPTWMMALLGLLAYKAIKGGGIGNMMGGGSPNAPVPNPGASGGGLGDVLGGMLGGGGARPGAAPGGGLGDVLGGMIGGGGARPGAAPGGGLGDVLGGMLGGGNARAGAGGGGLGDILGGLLAGGAAGGVLNGGLKNLLGDMESNGHGDVARSWVGTGQNQQMSPDDLGRAVGLEDIEAVAQQTGMPREQLLSELSQHLPQFVDQLTPEGREPTDDEASRWV